MQKPQKAKTIRLTEQDRQAMVRRRDYYALSSDNEALRFALKQALRAIEQQPIHLKPQ